MGAAANAAILVNILLSLTTQATAISATLAKAHAENRDVTPEEMQALFANDANARAMLQAAIDAKSGTLPQPATP